MWTKQDVEKNRPIFLDNFNFIKILQTSHISCKNAQTLRHCWNLRR